MDGDGELHPGDDVNASLPCASETVERHSGSNLKDVRDTGANDSNNNGGSGGSGGASGGGGDGDDDGGDGGGGEGGEGGGGNDKGDGDDDEDDDDEEEDGEEEEEYEDYEDVGDDDDSDEDRMHIDIPEEGEEEDDQDSTDGEPPSSLVLPGAAAESAVTTEKRVPVQSQRMRDYQAMQQIASQSSRPRTCPWCGRVLYSGPGFRYHLSTHRAAKESFTCDTCRKKFKSLNGLKYHRKRKRCKGIATSSASVLDEMPASVLPISQSTVGSHQTSGTATFEEEHHAQRLMELAKIATSPQSPLLQSPGPDSRGGVTGAFFDDSEASAVMALSNMMRSSESRKSLEACSSGTAQYSSLQLPHQKVPQQQQQQPQPQDSKSKRPMNGFMLFAQQHRAELKKKYPNTNNRMISTKLSEEWTQLPDTVRQQWKDEAKVKAEQQLKEHPDCWKRKK